MLGIRHDRTAAANAAARSFRETYRAALDFEGDGLALHEAAALLRLGCVLAKRETRATIAERLIEEASARLES